MFIEESQVIVPCLFDIDKFLIYAPTFLFDKYECPFAISILFYIKMPSILRVPNEH